MINIKKYYKYLFVLLEEYQEGVKKFDLVLLFIVPITIIVIGGIYYYIKNKRIIRRLRLK